MQSCLTMTRDEYEQRKQRLDEQLRAGIELLQAAHQRQVRALDVLWMTGGEEGVKIPLLAEAPAAAPLPVPPPAPPRARRGAGELFSEVLEALANVPEVFTRSHVCAQLGYEPDRGSLYRVLQELIAEGFLALQLRGQGRTPARYRKTDSGGGEAGL